jgi:hypothetical protein
MAERPTPAVINAGTGMRELEVRGGKYAIEALETRHRAALRFYTFTTGDF